MTQVETETVETILRQFEDSRASLIPLLQEVQAQFFYLPQEALRRMEAGEDPEQIEADMGDILEQEEPFLLQDAKTSKKRLRPGRDETLYDL